MKCLVPQLAWWLDTSPLLSVDFQPKNDDNKLRIATCGTDTHVRIWTINMDNEDSVPAGANLKDGKKTDTRDVEMTESSEKAASVKLRVEQPGGKIDIDLRADLTRHQRTVNIARFSNSGEILASGDDESNIILWSQPTVGESAPQLFNDNGEDNKENWQVLKVLRSHIEDVCDLCWSRDDLELISGSVDSSAILWNTTTGRSTHIFKEKKGFIQGVAFDPRGEFVTALSSDRCLYIYSVLNKRKIGVASKADIPKENGSISTKIFYDDTIKSFCRRLDFSPDGEILVAPSGVIEDAGKLTNCVYIFKRTDLTTPIAMIPSAGKFTTVIRFSRIFYKLRNDGENPLGLPYRMIFAVSTVDSVLVCDTETMRPFAVVSDAHYARISDLTWSQNNHILLASSTDGYCSFIQFSQQQLGEPYTGELAYLKTIVTSGIGSKKKRRPRMGGDKKMLKEGKKDDDAEKDPGNDVEMMDVTLDDAEDQDGKLSELSNDSKENSPVETDAECELSVDKKNEDDADKILPSKSVEPKKEKKRVTLTTLSVGRSKTEAK